MKDTMLCFGNDNLSTNFLSREDLKELCPVAFCESPTNPALSQQYVTANTMTVVEDLEKLGWRPVQAAYRKRAKKSKGIYSFHMIAFQNPGVRIMKEDGQGGQVVDCYPRIILTNSHDGAHSFKFMVGLFRLVCSNGLVIATNEMANFSVRHINYDFETLRGIVADVIKHVPSMAQKMNVMMATKATDSVRRDMAEEVFRLRNNIPSTEKVQIDTSTVDSILAPLRNEDNTDNLWGLFNVCQEKMINGGYMYQTKKSRFRKARRVSSIEKDLALNTSLWRKIEKYVPVAA